MVAAKLKLRVMVTGSTGFLGSALTEKLCPARHDVVALVRTSSKSLPAEVTQIESGDLSQLAGGQTVNNLLTTLRNIDVVVHCAAKAHVLKESSDDPETAFRRTNVDATLVLARLAAEAGVGRFIFLSSIGVNGNLTKSPNHPELPEAFDETVTPAPHDLYAQSKWQAEQGLMQIADATGMEVVIIRPPLVYGPNAKGNFASLLKWVKRGVPLPLGAVNNQRSFIALDNLVDFLRCCLVHPKAANEVFVISDGEDVSTTELLQKVANAVGRKARLIPVPVSWMRLAAKLTGKVAIADRLFGSLRVDISKARQLLAWKPKVTMQQQLESMASQAASTESSGGCGFPPSRE
ncbi:UDP-glucose 4-epimerase [Methylophaga lonarensis MPL]|uniref:UDP-glucose 4-epimerase n=1 Tax=Methylophaga lonarensis MPL TaxID=1286106 RepID=M7NXJ1_9GAMM|nr:SDR family oxidoreductase [Methylophaga lonarensis]EMR11896.1 UDP-glucose 4-epimerase [Methylophaga lonarensis MPL]